MNSEQLKKLISDVLVSIGFKLYSFEFKTKKNVSKRGKLSSVSILDISIQSLQNIPVTVQDCSFVSSNVSVAIDVANFISSKYYLSVSSPGVERILKSVEDYCGIIGQSIKINLYEPLDSNKTYIAKVLDVKDNHICINVKHTDLQYDIHIDKIKLSRVVLI
ncbi:ribosome maturation factor RimP [Rickettsia endosymbiont of Cardiosporidium cionae]|uniref:ribosome maturation factor RimP n=1 Tax=Rickettsia endosymbiont of Cardiosporidium cionae TaxID=2777155 RepID=UPI001893A954|nr:hypothetical protein [Rickettsia endosymbiont of Cardiosporidium cionae]KAF8818235.1 ribosome maturation factor [Rickettsia endosymbiont of Cardiosporidium cionae]